MLHFVMSLLTIRQVSLAVVLCLVNSKILETSHDVYYEYDYKRDPSHSQFIYVDDEDHHDHKFINTTNDQDEIRPVYQEDQAPSHYKFSYGVHDEDSGTAYSRKESSDGDKTTGQYQVALPDGRIQTVIYTADGNGYRAKVTYEGEAVHHPGTSPVVPQLHSAPGNTRSLEKFGGVLFPAPLSYNGEAAGHSHIHLPLINEDKGEAPDGTNDLNWNHAEHGGALGGYPRVSTSSSPIGKASPALVTHFPLAQVAPPPPTIYFDKPTPYPSFNITLNPFIKSYDRNVQDLKASGQGVNFDKHRRSSHSLGLVISSPHPIVKSHSKSTSNLGIQGPIHRDNSPYKMRLVKGMDIGEYSTSSPIWADS